MNTRSHNLELVSGGVEIEGKRNVILVNLFFLSQTVTPRQVEEVSKGKTMTWCNSSFLICSLCLSPPPSHTHTHTKLYFIQFSFIEQLERLV